MLGEKKQQKSFFDMAAEQRVSNHFLLKIDRLIDWSPLQKELSKLYHPQSWPSFLSSVLVQRDVGQ